jgi:hypothetical protein
MIMSADGSGRIVISERLPRGNLPIARGNEEELNEQMRMKARRGYDPGVYLVPGVPEAQNEDERVAALIRFMKFVGRD